MFACLCIMSQPIARLAASGNVLDVDLLPAAGSFGRPITVAEARDRIGTMFGVPFDRVHLCVGARILDDDRKPLPAIVSVVLIEYDESFEIRAEATLLRVMGRRHPLVRGRWLRAAG